MRTKLVQGMIPLFRNEYRSGGLHSMYCHQKKRMMTDPVATVRKVIASMMFDSQDLRKRPGFIGFVLWVKLNAFWVPKLVPGSQKEYMQHRHTGGLAGAG